MSVLNTLQRWLLLYQPAYIIEHEGKAVYARKESTARDVSNLHALYDSNGIWIGSLYTHFEINLFTLVAYRDKNTPFPSSRKFFRADTYRRLSWLARMLSPKLPTGDRAVILDTDDEIIGTTSFSER